MSEPKLYNGCYAELRCGKFVGPIWIEQDGPDRHRPAYADGRRWTAHGRIHLDGTPSALDVVNVLTSDEMVDIRLGLRSLPTPKEPTSPGIPEHVLQAARDAGLRAVPTYDLFIQEVVESAFAAAVKTMIQVPERSALFKALTDTLADRFPDKSRLECSEIARFASKVVMNTLYGSTLKPENESASGSDARLKTEGGQSGRRPNLVDPKQGHAVPVTFRTLDMLHPVLRAFLEAIYPDAPLRAVEFMNSVRLRAEYGRPMKPSETVTVYVSAPGRLPMWIDDGSTSTSYGGDHG